MRPTNVASSPSQSLGIGYLPLARSSTSLMPGKFANSSRASSAVIFRSVSTRMLSLWQFETGTRTQVQLSRKRGLAAEAHLFTSEFAAEGLTFVARPGFNGRLRLTRMSLAEDPPVYYELVLLLAGVKTVETLGGSASRGAGACRLDLPKTVMVNRQSLEVAQQVEYVEFLDPDLYREDREAQT